MALDKQYTLRSLQAWFYAYRPTWWALFSTNDIQQGQQWLKQGLRTLEIHSTYMLVCAVINRTPLFATLDLDEKGNVSFHCSKEESDTYRGLLVAGLILLEKLIVEHIDAITLPLEDEIESEESQPPSEVFSKKPPEVQLVFSKRDQTLWIDVFFRHGSKLDKLNALTQTLKPQERETFLSILLQAQKQGFKWCKDGLCATNIENFPAIIQTLLPKFAQKYVVECPEEIRNLAQGPQAIELYLSEQLGQLQQTFAVHHERLDDAVLTASLKSKHHLYWSDRYGLVEWKSQTLSWMRRMNDWKEYFSGKTLPSYLRVSIFNPNPAPPTTLSFDNQNTLAAMDLDGLTVPLRPYQKEGVRWLKQMLDAHYHPLLADEMGLGKTRQLWSILTLLQQENGLHLPSLVICPASVTSAWQNEYELYFSSLPMELLSQETWEQSKTKPTIFITSYSQLRRLQPLLKPAQFNCIILDEAQFIKNPKSQTAHICFHLKAKYRIVATGTPLENRLTDVWSIFHFLMPGLLGHFKEFQTFIQREDHQQRLKQQIAPFILRRTQKEVLSELPEKTEVQIYCPMTPVQKQGYEQLLQHRKNVETGQWIRLLTLILRLRQMCCDPGLIQPHLSIDSGGKFRWLIQFLTQHRQNLPKIIIFSQFAALLNRIQPEIENFYDAVYLLTGRTPTAQRRQMIRSFQKTNQRAAFLISLKAGGTGITLHTANAVFILDPWWNPAVEQQAIARAYRLGKTYPLTVYRLLIENSIESSIQHLQKNKIELFNQLFNSTAPLSSAERWQQLYNLLEQ